MFWIGLGVGLVLGANIALVLYALILVNKDEDKYIENHPSVDF